jgi:hypothetical protein
MAIGSASGVGATFLAQLLVVVLLALGTQRALLLISGGAGWIRAFFTDTLVHIANKTMLLDWYDLQHKCLELSNPICRGKHAKRWLLLRQIRRRWRGDVAAAIALLEAHRPQTRNTDALETFIV